MTIGLLLTVQGLTAVLRLALFNAPGPKAELENILAEFFLLGWFARGVRLPPEKSA